jgi:hypothetical protein
MIQSRILKLLKKSLSLLSLFSFLNILLPIQYLKSKILKKICRGKGSPPEIENSELNGNTSVV